MSEEPSAQQAEFRYVLSQGTKEGLVTGPLEWPGVNPAKTFAAGRMTMHGEWVDRTAMRKAREKGRDVSEVDFLCSSALRAELHGARSRTRSAPPLWFTYQETLELTPISCLEHLSQEEYLAWVCEVIEDIELEAKRMHEENGTRPLGAEAVCAKDPMDEPAPAKKTPAPLFRTASREAFLELMEAYRQVVSAYMEASARFRAGEQGVEFPIGTFPPAPKPRLHPPPRGPGP